MLSDAKSYAERLFTYREITQLDQDAAPQALIKPAAGEGVSWQEAAVSYVVKEARSYPYFLQEYGQATWNAAGGTTLPMTTPGSRPYRAKHTWMPGSTAQQ